MRLDELAQRISAYQRGSISLDVFEDWFRSNSRGMFGESPEVLTACIAVEEAFSELRAFEEVEQFREELAAAIRPFRESSVKVVSIPALSIGSFQVKGQLYNFAVGSGNNSQNIPVSIPNSGSTVSWQYEVATGEERWTRPRPLVMHAQPA